MWSMAILVPLRHVGAMCRTASAAARDRQPARNCSVQFTLKTINGADSLAPGNCSKLYVLRAEIEFEPIGDSSANRVRAHWGFSAGTGDNRTMHGRPAGAAGSRTRRRGRVRLRGRIRNSRAGSSRARRARPRSRAACCRLSRWLRSVPREPRRRAARAGARNPAGRDRGPNAGAEQRLVRVDVAHAHHELVVHERELDRRGAAARRVPEVRRRRTRGRTARGRGCASNGCAAAGAPTHSIAPKRRGSL